MKNYFHIFSNGQKSDIIFNSKEEKIFTANSIPICALKLDIKILVFIINDTHFHLIAYGDEDSIKSYCDKLKIRLCKFLPIDNTLLISMIKINDVEHLKRSFMYVYRNSLDFYKTLPWNYPWGVGNLFFTDQIPENQHCKSMGEINEREKRELFKTRTDLPDEWFIDANGMISPGSYIDVKMVENIFISPRAFLAFLYIKKDEEIAIKQTFFARQIETRSLQNLREIANNLSKEKFNKTCKFLNYTEKLHIAACMLNQAFTGKTPSLAKAVFLDPEDLKLI
jgi:hypothetical protein